MGYARIFWINEAPIRRYLAENGQSDFFFREVGEKVLSISVADSFAAPFIGDPIGDNPQPFFDQDSVFYPSKSVHSNDFYFFVWTGQRLEYLGEVTAQQFDCMYYLQNKTAPRHMVTALPEEERDLVVAGKRKWDNSLQNAGEFSIYWIYEDFTRDYKNVPKTKGSTGICVKTWNFLGTFPAFHNGTRLRSENSRSF